MSNFIQILSNMKNLIYIIALFFLIFGCTTTKDTKTKTFQQTDKALQNDTIKIANEELEYEVIIIDPGFNSWFYSYARPRNYYSQQYMETRNRVWVMEWNSRFNQGDRRFDMSIDYQNNINYGYEVNYMLYNYLTYFQLTHNIKLGGFVPRI